MESLSGLTRRHRAPGLGGARIIVDACVGATIVKAPGVLTNQSHLGSSRVATRSAALSGASCSHILRVVQPSSRSLASVSESRCLFVWNFHSHHSRLAFGTTQCSGQACQKQPSTKTAKPRLGEGDVDATAREARERLYCTRYRSPVGAAHDGAASPASCDSPSPAPREPRAQSRPGRDALGSYLGRNAAAAVVVGAMLHTVSLALPSTPPGASGDPHTRRGPLCRARRTQ